MGGVFALFRVMDVNGDQMVPLKDLLLSMPQSNDAVDVLTLRFETKRLTSRIAAIMKNINEIRSLLQQQIQDGGIKKRARAFTGGSDMRRIATPLFTDSTPVG